MNRLAAITSFHDELLAERATHDEYWLNGWGSAEGQHARFAALARATNYRGGSVVDFGCGTGALYRFLATLGYPFTYLGLDLNEPILEIARTSRAGGEFRLIEADAVDFPPADYVFASGVFQFFDAADPHYYRELVAALFERCRVALGVNFLSAMRDDAAKDPDELYVLPAEAIDLAASLSGNWMLDHSYHPDKGDMTLGVHA
jgi:SAM-dependent methyltransferase